MPHSDETHRAQWLGINLVYFDLEVDRWIGAAAGIRTRVVWMATRYLTRLDYGRQHPSYELVGY